ncbi:MAG: FMN-binding protein [Chromatiales bacterium]|jgi:electron transport complex protein RnfG
MPAAEQVSSARMVMAMAGIGILSGILLVATYIGTLPAIERNKAAALERAIFDVIPGGASKVTFARDGEQLRPLAEGEAAAVRYHAAYDEDGALAGVAIEAQGQGFADVLKVLYGYSPDCRCIVGFKVLESKETPGLGDKIETDSAFTANFEALDVSLDESGGAIANPIVFAKPGQKSQAWQIEGITGATISSKAVTRILHESTADVVIFLERNLQVLRDGSSSSLVAKSN